MPFVTLADGCRIHHEIHGARGLPVVVFLNGTAQTTHNWRPLAGRLKTRFQVLLYDERCQGSSGAGDLSPDAQQHAADLVSLLDALEIRRASLVGLSHGGRIAFEAAAAHPGRIERVVCVSTTLEPSARRQVLVASWVEVLQSADVAAVGWAMMPFIFGEAFLASHRRVLGAVVQAMVVRNRKEALLGYLKTMAAPVHLPLAPLNGPCLMVCGSDDPICPASRVASSARRLGAALCIIDGSGHSVPVESPARFQEVVENFLLAAGDPRI